MIAKDDPAHHEQRALVARRFTPKAVQRLEAAIDATVARPRRRVHRPRRARGRRRARRTVPGAAHRAPPRLRRGPRAVGALVVGAAHAHRPARGRPERDDGHDDGDPRVRHRARTARRGPAARHRATTSCRSGPTPSSAAARWIRRCSCKRPDCSSRAAPRRRAPSSRVGCTNWRAIPTRGRRWRPTRRDPGRGRGAHPLGDAAQQHVPHRDARRRRSPAPPCATATA